MKNSLKTVLLGTCIVACTPQTSEVRGLWKTTLSSDTQSVIQIDARLEDIDTQNNLFSIIGPSDGEFRGALSSPDQPIAGFYIQPGNEFGGQRLAHPVTLTPTQSGEWSGQAEPLERDFSVFMHVTEAKNKSLKAVLLNPERNITGPARQYYFTGDETGNDFALTMPNDGTAVTSARLDRDAQILIMDFGPMSDLVFSPVQERSAESQRFFGVSDVKRLSPPDSSGAWPISSLEKTNFNAPKLLKLTQDIAGVSGDEGQPELVHSLLIARKGQLVYEEYFRGHTKDKSHDIRSAGKTFASVLVGALIADGVNLSKDTPINKFVEVPNEITGNPVTLSDLLTHQSGLDCYDGDNASPGNEDKMWQQEEHDNFWAFTSALPVIAEPGTQYAYCSGGINLVGAVLAGASNETVLSLLDKKIFQPLGFEKAYWNVMPDGEAYLGGGAHLRTRDLMKIGQLYLDEGKWKGTQLIDPDWAAASTRPIIKITPETTGLEEAAFNRFYFGGTDGLAWHLHTVTVDDVEYDTFEASGNGGQMVVVVPELDLVVGMTGGNYMEGFVWGKWRQSIIADGIIAALDL